MPHAVSHSPGFDDTCQEPTSVPFAIGLRHRIGQLVHQLMLWSRRHRQRRDLVELDDHLLADIGVTRERALREAGRPFWA